MNERIIELAEQSGLEYNFDPTLWLKYEKFAELIVRDCMEQVYYTREDKIDETISQNIKERMKQHFGVE